MNYLEVARAALREHQDPPAPKAYKAYKGSMPLPPEGDPRRRPIEIIDQVWAAGGWLVITDDQVRAVSRGDGASSDRLTTNLVASVAAHQAELLYALARVPGGVRASTPPATEPT